MLLRQLEQKDAPLMLAWMKDKSVVGHLRTDFGSKTLRDAEAFIQASRNMGESVNLAIASDTDEYMGTVSLKHIERETDSAEFAITVRKEAMGQGYAWFGMRAILEKAFDEWQLRRVYWCVSRENLRAIRFYDKHGFRETPEIPRRILERYQDAPSLKWYKAEPEDICGLA